MAKVPFSKLNKVKNLPVTKHDFNDNEIIVEQYLPLEEKVNLMEAVISQAGNGEEGFFNIVKLEVYYRVEMIQAYTNISFTDKQLEDITKLYDSIVLNGIWEFVEKAIPEKEREYIWNNILNLAKEITSYNNSILGVLKGISNNYNNLDLEAANIQQKLADPNNLTLLRDVLSNLG